MNKLWSDRAWDDYLYWQTQDKKTLKKINDLIKDIERNGLSEGIGKPEPLLPHLFCFFTNRSTIYRFASSSCVSSSGESSCFPYFFSSAFPSR